MTCLLSWVAERIYSTYVTSLDKSIVRPVREDMDVKLLTFAAAEEKVAKLARQ